MKQKNNYIPDTVLLLQPTSPFRKLNELKKAIYHFKNNKIDSMVGAASMTEHPTECLELKKNTWNFLKKNKLSVNRRQEYRNNFYFIDGSFYLAKVSFLKKNNSFVIEKKTCIYKLNQKYSIDIDDYSDLKIAKELINIY